MSKLNINYNVVVSHTCYCSDTLLNQLLGEKRQNRDTSKEGNVWGGIKSSFEMTR